MLLTIFLPKSSSTQPHHHHHHFQVNFFLFCFLGFFHWIFCSRQKRQQEMELENMVALVSRTGRHLQRYNNKGCRQVVGCIPYRYKITKKASLVDEDALEVLVISAQRKGKGMLFPKGGWETDESIVEAALRETVEEAGVIGDVEHVLGKWKFESQNKEGYMFPLLVKEQLEYWPEKDVRQRKWISVTEARKVCQLGWMKEALELLVIRLTSEENEANVVENCLQQTQSQERRSNL